MNKLFEIAEVEKKTLNGHIFVDVETVEKIVRFYHHSREYEANDGVPPNSIIESKLVDGMNDFLYLVIDKSKWSIENREKNMKPFMEACEPLMKYLAENHHPHTTAIVESNRAQLLEGLMVYPTDKFIGD